MGERAERDCPQIDQAVLDRLVDGELTPAEVARVVQRLDQLPDGWKRCAVTFLEAQALQTDLLEILDSRDSAATRKPDPVGTAGRAPRRSASGPAAATSHWNWLLAIAASGLLSFLLGRTLPPQRAPVTSGPATETAGSPASQPVPPGTSHELPGTSQELPGTSQELLAGTPEPSSVPVGNLRLQFSDAVGSPSQQIQLPVYALDESNARWLSQPAEVPPEFVQAVQQMGSRVERKHGLLPVPLENGQQILVPIEQVEIVPVGGRLFQ